MKTLKRILSLLMTAVLIAAVLCGCGDGKQESASKSDTPTSSSTGEPVRGGEITVGIAQDLDDSLDPHKMTAAGTREILFNVFEGLVKPDSDGNLIPAVASEYSISPEADQFTFTLREGVKFHDGSTVTVGDVCYSISRAAGLDTGEPLVSGLAGVTKVESPDDKTVIVYSDGANIELLSFLSAASIIPEGSDPADGLIGTGPFKFVSRAAQENVIIEKFADYWGEGAYLDKVTYKIIENSDALVMSLKSGAVDLCAHLTSAQANELKDDFNVLEGSMNLVQAVYLNNAYEPLSNMKVRQALCYAVNRQEILDIVSDGMGSILGSSMYPAFTKYYEDLTGVYTYDPDKAVSLLKEAGYENGFDLEITVPSNYQLHVDTAQVVAEQLKAVGINCTIKPVDWSTWLSDVYQGRNYQATVVGVDTSNGLNAESLLSRFVSDRSNNFINFNSADYDETFNKAVSATTEDEQITLYKQCETILANEAANIYIQDPADLVVINKKLTGYTFYPLYVMDMSKVAYVG